MEEWVGSVWHRLVTKAAVRRYPEMAVRLDDISKSLSIFFRALGGDAGLKVVAAPAMRHSGRRRWLQRVAGSDQKIELSWRDSESLRLPTYIDFFPQRERNHDLYIWLAALSASDVDEDLPWFERNQRATLNTLERFPGLARRYRELVDATLQLRLPPENLPTDEAAQERAIRQALLQPGSIAALPAASKPFQPVLLWPHPLPPNQSGLVKPSSNGAHEHTPSEHREILTSKQKYLAERTEMPDGKDGFLMMFRAESIFSWSEYIKVNRPQDEDDSDNALRTAEDMDMLTIARDTEASKAKVRFDLDLPPAAEDDEITGDGIPLPEWDFRKNSMRADYCFLYEMESRFSERRELPAHLRPVASKLRNQFQAIMPVRSWLRAQEDGDDIDFDQWIQLEAERAMGVQTATRGLYRQQVNRHRDMACLLLADLSLSTDTYVSDHAKVIDVIRDSLFLFSEVLLSIGDRFALYGFSSLKRSNVRFHRLKGFDEQYDPIVRGRITQIKPGFYTRMGAAIRHATKLINAQKSQQRLLLLLSDGKPNDLDQYEGRYGIEDTRNALLEAKRVGVKPFCVTIDQEAHDYLPYLFGADGYVVIRKPEELPENLMRLYAQMTR
jgi:nitric oxide reductase NorD protein